MVTTRSNRQTAGASPSSPASSVGSKRKAEDAEGGTRKRERKASLKQTTIEDTLNGEAMDVDKPDPAVEDKTANLEQVVTKTVGEEPVAVEAPSEESKAAESTGQERVEEQNIEAKVAETKDLKSQKITEDIEMKDAPSEEPQDAGKAEANDMVEPVSSEEKQQPEQQPQLVNEAQPAEPTGLAHQPAAAEPPKQPDPVAEAEPAQEPTKQESERDVSKEDTANNRQAEPTNATAPVDGGAQPADSLGDAANARKPDESRDEPIQEQSTEEQREDTFQHKPEESNIEGTSSKDLESKDAVQTGDKKREETTPSTILEKGLIYFFFRGRVGIDSPSEVNEIARSYIILRPIPHGAKLVDGKIADHGKNRLLALPKKILPQSGKDKFLTFVEKTNISVDEIKGTVLKHNDYETKTAGSRHSPAAIPVGEGVYAISSTGTTRDTHLSYMLTIPSELSEVQKDIGLKEKASFVANVKNPQYSSPPNAALPKGAEYSKE